MPSGSPGRSGQGGRAFLRGVFDGRLARRVLLGGIAGFSVGALVGFAVAASQLGVPAVMSLVGLVSGVAAGALVSLRRPARREEPEPARHRSRAGAAAPDAQTGAPAGRDQEWVVPPGWYPDPGGSDAGRYWDGEDWTERLWSTGSEPPLGSPIPEART